MTHELHERRKANACPEHVGSEGVSKIGAGLPLSRRWFDDDDETMSADRRV
jgi:hypothetical protein